MGDTSDNAAQAEFWSSAPGRKWATHQARLDLLFGNVRDLLIGRAAARPGERVLDIGCGTGDTTLAFAGRVAPAGSVLGVDISAPLLEIGRSRAAGRAGVEFRCDDAQTAGFAPGGADLVASRFGVMFFADPVAAFANLRGALRPGGRLALVCWAAADRNPWTAITRDAGVARLGPAPVEPPGTAGQFGFAEIGRVLGILGAAGFHDPRGEEVAVDLVVAGDAAAAADSATSIGPMARIMAAHDGTEADRVAIAAAVAGGFEAFVRGGEVRVPARVNVFTAGSG